MVRTCEGGKLPLSHLIMILIRPVAFVLLTLPGVAISQTSDFPPGTYREVYHLQNNMRVAVSNGAGFAAENRGSLEIDPVTGRLALLGYPSGSNIASVSFSFSMGGIRDFDTIVTNDLFWTPPTDIDGGIVLQSANPRSTLFSRNAKSPLDIRCSFSDTIPWPYPPWLFDADKSHFPLGISIDQTSMAWSSSVTDDFVLIRTIAKNTSSQPIKSTFIGYSYFAVCYSMADTIIPDYLPNGLAGSFPADLASSPCRSVNRVFLAYGMGTNGIPGIPLLDAS